MTEDKDFGELVFRRSRGTPGIVLLRIESGNNQRARDRLAHAVAHFGEQLHGRYTWSRYRAYDRAVCANAAELRSQLSARIER